jgi:predicted DCC family thiol-disulfide oxidoreductase YuxK
VTTERTVLYDDDCGFCKWSLDKLLAWDRRHALRALPIQGEEGERLLASIPRERWLESFHVVMPDGAVRSAGAAAPALAEVLPAGAPLAFLFRRLPRPTQRAYQWVADHRSRLGSLVGVDASCGLRR